MVIAAHGLFHGMKAADTLMLEQKSGKDENNVVISQHQRYNSVFQDMIDENITQEVEETRDEMYRTYRASEDYEVHVRNLFDEGSTVQTYVTKKANSRFLIKADVYNPEDYIVRVIQDNKFIPINSNMFPEYVLDSFNKTCGKDYYTQIQITRDGFLPRFRMEDYANKVVVRYNEKNEYFIDIYTTKYASQFGKTDALYIAELNRIKDGNVRSDTVDIDTLKFVTDKAAGCYDLFMFEFNNINFVSINEYDGNFVLTFKANVVYDGLDLTEKYKTKSLDEKLASHAPRENKAIDLDTAVRNIEKFNESIQKLDF